MENERRTRVAQVISAKMNKTVVAGVEVPHRHRLYGKVLRKTVRVKAHVEGLKCAPGDIVRIVETRPLSKEKRWRVTEIVRKGKMVDLKALDIVPEEAAGSSK